MAMLLPACRLPGVQVACLPASLGLWTCQRQQVTPVQQPGSASHTAASTFHSCKAAAAFLFINFVLSLASGYFTVKAVSEIKQKQVSGRIRWRAFKGWIWVDGWVPVTGASTESQLPCWPSSAPPNFAEGAQVSRDGRRVRHAAIRA